MDYLPSIPPKQRSTAEELLPTAARLISGSIHDWSSGGLPCTWPTPEHYELAMYYLQHYPARGEDILPNLESIIEHRDPHVSSDRRRQLAQGIFKTLNQELAL